MASLPDLGGLAIFARVAECRSFTDAAAQIGHWALPCLYMIIGAPDYLDRN